MTGRKKLHLLSGELAALAGVSADTIRFYERKGLIQRAHRSPAGYRQYPADSILRVRLIRSALAVGFTIAELTEVLNIRDRGGKPCQRVQQMARVKLQKIETMIHQLKQTQKDLQQCVEEWDVEMACSTSGEKLLLLEKLANRASSNRGKSSPFLPAGLKQKRRPK